ncbi:NADP-dependent oxidoreductase [Bacillus salacetis]|uniref:NADP-dependent oxidoreductase n=1 Tax=Bacillus salacetis TaxID=2315464 RepID=A0A3A1R037_9BACI|nr:NADP-dependent oxidoreductase [Bacillus salacetis]RIW34718.1 NADP-dependent oxidoreductase [Bacillus salacetis]
MKAIVINQYGGKEVLKETDMDIPEIGSEQVLLEVHATSINPIDWKLREGHLQEKLPFDFPIILGWDAAGIIKETGKNVTEFKSGDRVFARPATTNRGTYAEYTAVDSNLLAKMPDKMSYAEAAAIPLAGLTAWQCVVEFGEVKQGDKVLIHAGAGGVGIYAIQIAKSLGAKVVTTASDKNIDFLQSLGADRVINYKKEEFSDVLKEVDFVLDSIGGDVQTNSYKVLKENGKLVSIVSPPDEEEAKKFGVKAGFLWLDPNGEQLKKLSDAYSAGNLKPVIGTTLKFSEEALQEAHAISETHHARGKIVIIMKE